MSLNGYSTDIHSFINNVLEPSECLSKVFMFGREETDEQPKSEHYDVGVVTAALATLARVQLYSFATQLEARYGELRVTLPADKFLPTSVVDIVPKAEK